MYAEAHVFNPSCGLDSVSNRLWPQTSLQHCHFLWRSCSISTDQLQKMWCKGCNTSMTWKLPLSSFFEDRTRTSCKQKIYMLPEPNTACSLYSTIMRLLRKTRDRSLHLTTAAPSALFCVWHSTDIIRSAHCCEPTALWEDDWSQTTVSRQVRCCCIQTLLQLTLHVTTPDTSTDSCSQHSLTEILPFMKTLARG